MSVTTTAQSRFQREHVRTPKEFSASTRWVAALAGVIAASAAVYILTSDAIDTGLWTMDAILAPVVIVLTVLVGILACATWTVGSRPLSAAMWLIFTAGTMLTVYLSIGRQEDVAATHAKKTEIMAPVIAAERKRLQASQAMLVSEQSLAAKACEGGNGAKCTGVKESIAVYERAIKGSLATLKELGPEAATGGAGIWLAKLVTLIGGNGNLARELSAMMVPLARTLVIELGVIVCAHIAFKGAGRSGNSSVRQLITNDHDPAMPVRIEWSSGPATKIIEPSAGRYSMYVTHTTINPGISGNGPGPSAPDDEQARSAIKDYIRRQLTIQRMIPQSSVIDDLGAHRSTVSDAVNSMAKDGEIMLQPDPADRRRQLIMATA